MIRPVMLDIAAALNAVNDAAANARQQAKTVNDIPDLRGHSKSSCTIGP